MSKLKIDSPFFRVMGQIGDVIVLNLLWLICSLPVVTAGTSSVALLYAARRLAADESGGVGRDFFRAFRVNWKQATALFFLLLCLGIPWTLVLTLCGGVPDPAGSLFRGIAMMTGLLWVAVSGWTFALLARYEYALPALLRDAFFQALRHPVISVANLAGLLWFPILWQTDLAFALYLLPVWILAGGGGTAYLFSRLLLPVFREMESE